MILASVVAAAAVKLAGLPTLSGVPVYVGPPTSDAGDLDLVMIGDDGDPESDATASVEYEWASLAQADRYEVGTIPAAVICQAGDTDMQARLDRAQVLQAACEAAFMADRSLAGLVMDVHITGGTLRPIQNRNGAAAVAPLTITYRAQV